MKVSWEAYVQLAEYLSANGVAAEVSTQRGRDRHGTPMAWHEVHAHAVRVLIDAHGMGVREHGAWGKVLWLGTEEEALLRFFQTHNLVEESD